MIVAGFGFTSRATADSLRSALDATGHGGDVALIATAQDKATQPSIRDLSEQMQLSIKPILPAALEAAQTTTLSARSAQERRTGSLAEAAALAAIGPGATLIATRQISQDRMATCAIAKGADT